MKHCRNKKCTQQNPQSLNCFYKHNRNKDGLVSYCKTCFSEKGKQDYLKNKDKRKEVKLKWSRENPDVFRGIQYKKYYWNDLTAEEAFLKFKGLEIKQKGLCKICNKEENNKSLSVDHCHTTNKVRGLLCTKCNMGLGHFRDNIELLELAIKYLKESK